MAERSLEVRELAVHTGEMRRQWERGTAAAGIARSDDAATVETPGGMAAAGAAGPGGMAAASSAGQDGSPMWRAVGYVRLSREDQLTGESDSISGQRLFIDQWARARGDVSMLGYYSDDGYSGATFDRPGFRRMIADAAALGFDTIVVKDLSRFGRSYLDCGSWIERKLPRLGIRLYAIADRFDSMTAFDYDSALMLPFKNLVNEMHVAATSQKVRASIQAKRDRGECVANFAPYGYVKDPSDRHRLVVDEQTAQVVRCIFSMYLAGASASEIARNLNGRGVAPPAERKRQLGMAYRTGFGGEEPSWHAAAVLRVLRNESYTGVLVQGKTRRPNWRMRDPVVVADDLRHRTAGAHDAIVSAADFGKVRDMLDAQGRARAARQQGHAALAGEMLLGDADLPSDCSVHISVQLKCEGCGGPMRRIAVVRSGKRYAYYVCAAHRKDVRSCSPHSIREEDLAMQVAALQRAGALDGGSVRLAVGNGTVSP